MDDLSKLTKEQLVEELKKREALEIKAIYDHRHAVANYVRDNIDVFNGLLKLFGHKPKHESDIGAHVVISLDIREDKFLDRVYTGNSGQPAWAPHTKE